MSWVVKPTSTAMMLLAMRRNVVRVSERLWPRKSWEGRVNWYICFAGAKSGPYDLAFVDVAGLVEEGVHCEWSAVCVEFFAQGGGSGATVEVEREVE
jgi:hypothetical protein